MQHDEHIPEIIEKTSGVTPHQVKTEFHINIHSKNAPVHDLITG